MEVAQEVNTRIKGGGGRLFPSARHRPESPEPDPNIPTEPYELYNYWLRQNGAVFPSCQYPGFFGPDRITGVQAVEDIPPEKAFAFIPHKLVISADKANNGEIGFVLYKFPHLFEERSDSEDLTLYVYCLYEKLKGSKSFWFPYFLTSQGMDILMFWDEASLDELQDPVLKHRVKKDKEKFQEDWAEVYRAIKNYPTFFKGTKFSLEQEYRAAYIMVVGRCYDRCGLPCSMMVPFGDNFNHGNVSTDHEFLEKQTLLDNETKYADFQQRPPTPKASDRPMKTNRNRLKKFLDNENNENHDFENIQNIWDIEPVLSSYRSSDDEEDNGDEDEESEDEEEEVKENDQYPFYHWRKDDNYFVLSTGKATSYEAGEEVLISYGKRSNAFLLSTYGFAMENNIFDSFLLRLWKPGLKYQWFSPNDEINETYKADISIAELDDVSDEYYLKHNKLCDEMITYFRKEVLENIDMAKNPELKEEAKHLYMASPSNVQIELYALAKVRELLGKLGENFITSVESDEMMLETAEPRLRYAILYRVAQKRILESQIKLFDDLYGILERMNNGDSLKKAHMDTTGNKGELVKKRYPLRKYLMRFKVNRNYKKTGKKGLKK